jgi:hypothetical protein
MAFSYFLHLFFTLTINNRDAKLIIFQEFDGPETDQTEIGPKVLLLEKINKIIFFFKKKKEMNRPKIFF